MISNPGSGGRRSLPHAFTEHGGIIGVGCPAGSSDWAIEMSVLVDRALARLRGISATHKELAHKLEEPKHDTAIGQLIAPPSETLQIGFEAREKTG